jgi:membrane dipeptidase
MPVSDDGQAAAEVLLRDTLVWDGLISWTSMDLMGAAREFKGQVVPDYLGAGVNVADLTIAGDYGSSYQRTRGWIASQRRYFADNHPDDCIIVDRFEDLESAAQSDKLAVMFHFQGGTPFLHFESEASGDLDLIQFYFDLGVRRAALALNYRNALADGCFEPGDAGLSVFGQRAVEEMNRVGMVLDCTHTAKRSTLEIIDLSSKPCVFSHSNACGVFDHPRNIDDEQIKACANRGGLIGICGWGPIVNRENEVSVDAIAQHLVYVADLVGPTHIGVGLDYVYDPELTTQRVKAQPDIYAPVGGTFEDWNYHHELMAFAPPSIFLSLAELMLDRGFSETDVRGVLGENWLRVYRENWGS